MNKKNLLIFVVLLSILVLPFSAHAYTLLGYKWPKNSSGIAPVTYKWGDRLQTPGSVIRTGFENAVRDWNAAQRHVRLSHNSSSGNILNSYHLSSTTEYGYCRYWYSGSTMTRFEAYVNAGNSNITRSNVARSVAGHEIGHGIGLGHSSQVAIMNSSRDRTRIYTPQTDDINGINAMYR